MNNVLKKTCISPKLSGLLCILILTAVGYKSRAQVCFSVDTTFVQGGSPNSICNADFNNDGSMDLATANWGANSLSILLNNGSGGFGAPTNITLTGYPSSVTSADFNGDGKMDLAAARYFVNDMVVFLGTGTGTFGSPTTYTTGGSSAYCIISADANGDGKKDLIVSNAGSSDLSVFIGNGNGTFGAASNYSVINPAPFYVASGDFNGDGHIDMATSNNNGGNLSILIGSGTGSFTFTDSIHIALNPRTITCSDFNADGYDDLAVQEYGGSLWVVLANGSGGFNTPVAYSLPPAPYHTCVKAGDLDGDGKTDLAVVSDQSNILIMLFGNGNGTFASAVTAPAGAVGGSDATITDLNNDGRQDIAIANLNSSRVSILLNYSSPTITVTPSAVNACQGSSVILAAAGSSTYSWSTGATTSTISVSPSATTTYSVNDGVGCSNTATATVTVPVNSAPQICVASVDSATNFMYNNIYWDKTLYPAADSFLVYRYDVISGLYLKIGAVDKTHGVFTDSAFNIGGPNGGNPLYSSWKYKLAILDTCSNESPKSPYHETMFVQQSGSMFSWNAYAVEAGQSNPVTGYSFLRDNNNNGNWNVLVNTAGLSTTDPNYSAYPNGNWRVDALGFNCAFSFRLSNNSTNMSGANKRSHSNTSKPVANAIQALSTSQPAVSIYPNPASNSLTVRSSAELGLIEIGNSLGETIAIIRSESKQEIIDISRWPAGIYLLKANGHFEKFVKN